jgi:segregation and condensation protein A
MSLNLDLQEGQRFDGPLDLLLYLIKRNEVDLDDIPMSLITEQYLDHLRLMEPLDLDTAGDFLLMASTLANIKSRILLPQNALRGEGEEGEGGDEDPRLQLVRPLMEYARFRQLAELLGDRYILDRDVFARGMPNDFADAPPPEEAPVRVSLFELVEAWRGLAGRAAKVPRGINFRVEAMTIGDKLRAVRAFLVEAGSAHFMELLGRGRTDTLVVTDYVPEEGDSEDLGEGVFQEEDLGAGTSGPDQRHLLPAAPGAPDGVPDAGGDPAAGVPGAWRGRNAPSGSAGNLAGGADAGTVEPGEVFPDVRRGRPCQDPAGDGPFGPAAELPDGDVETRGDRDVSGVPEDTLGGAPVSDAGTDAALPGSPPAADRTVLPGSRQENGQDVPDDGREAPALNGDPKVPDEGREALDLEGGPEVPDDGREALDLEGGPEVPGDGRDPIALEGGPEVPDGGREPIALEGGPEVPDDGREPLPQDAPVSPDSPALPALSFPGAPSAARGLRDFAAASPPPPGGMKPATSGDPPVPDEDARHGGGPDGDPDAWPDWDPSDGQGEDPGDGGFASGGPGMHPGDDGRQHGDFPPGRRADEPLKPEVPITDTWDAALSFIAVLELARTGFLRLYQDTEADARGPSLFLANPDAEDAGDLDYS